MQSEGLARKERKPFSFVTVPKKSKKKSSAEAFETKDATPEAPPPTAAKPSSSTPKPATRKKTASAKTAKAPKEKKPETAGQAPTEPSDSDISIRAYFIAERRTRLSLGGDPATDWIEARRQLIEEAEERPR